MFQSWEYRMAGLLVAFGAALAAMGSALRSPPQAGAGTLLLAGAIAAGIAIAGGRAWRREAARRAQRRQAAERERAEWQGAAAAAESGRRETEERFAKIAAQAPGALFELRQAPDGRRAFSFATEGFRRLYRLAPQAAAADAAGVFDAIHPEDGERFAESLARSAATLTRWECEHRVRFPDETVIWLQTVAQPERRADGATVWHGCTHEVTERKRAEQAHEESRVLLQSVFSSVDLGVFVVEVTSGGGFRFAEVNPAYERLTGFAATEIRGRGPRDLAPLIPEELGEALCASFRRGTESSGPIEYEEPFNIRGRALWLLTRLTPLRDPAGNVVRLVGRSLDITERKTIELRFQSLTERLQLATEAAQVGIWDHDFVHERLMWDSRMHTLYGIAPRDFAASFAAWKERVHPDDRARAVAELQKAVEGKGAFNTSFRIVRPDGQERQIRARAHVQRNSAGRPVRMVGVNWDVTAERRAQAEIERARDEAEQLNRQLEDALDRAHRLAQEAAAATVAKSEFLANMSHEIRTPLNAVLGMSSVLLGTALSPEQREFAETIRSSGDGLLDLLNDILDYSKIESGRLDLEVRTFDLRECVESAMDVLGARAAEKRLELLCEFAPGVPEAVGGDDTRLRQVFVNLLSNAVKFTAEGQIVLGAEVVAREPGKQRLRFAVQDSGIGIPEERMNRLFKSFSQVDASTTRQFGGTGLGLAICKRLVELMGGRIWAESAPGRGSTFFFEVEIATVAESAKPFATGSSPVLAGRRVLVVQANAASRRLLAAQCAAWGLAPRTAASAAEALAAPGACDLVLIDGDAAAEPGGVEAVARLRGAAPAPIVMLVRPGQARTGEALGIAAFVSKPIKAAVLFETLVEIFHGRTAKLAAPANDDATLAAAHPLSILLAEDNPVNQRVATLILQRMGYRADVAANGREAVEAVARRRYDLVLMDVQMPEMDGLQATREIGARCKPGARPRIVAMTANASTADRDQCLAAGMDDFLPKPVRQADLRQVLAATPAQCAANAALIADSSAA
jgi:PAS domain S-box-containing protein